jgi:hypothetical protein
MAKVHNASAGMNLDIVNRGPKNNLKESQEEKMRRVKAYHWIKKAWIWHRGLPNPAWIPS